MKFCPRPPYSCFTTIIANTPPSMGIQTGISGGIFNARIIPVTRALPSIMVMGRCISFSYTYSLAIQAATVARITSSA